MGWTPKNDCLHYLSYTNLYQNKKPKHSKRGISSIVPSLYDPIGLIQPYIVEGKILLQKTWCYRDEKDQALQWDDPLPKHLEEDFIKWTSLLKDVSTSKFPRYLFTELD